jgi:hypothetical protein
MSDGPGDATPHQNGVPAVALFAHSVRAAVQAGVEAARRGLI